MSNNVEGLSEGVEDRRRMSGVSKGIGEGLGDDVEGYDQGRDTRAMQKNAEHCRALQSTAGCVHSLMAE